MSYACVLIYDEDSPDKAWEEDFNCFDEAKEYLLNNKERNLVAIEVDDCGEISGYILSLRKNSGNILFHPDHPNIVELKERERAWRKKVGLSNFKRL
jgi:hypothetical protein